MFFRRRKSADRVYLLCPDPFEYEASKNRVPKVPRPQPRYRETARSSGKRRDLFCGRLLVPGAHPQFAGASCQAG